MDECNIKLKKKNEIILLKLGGSLLTDKNTPFSLREDILESCINQISKSKKDIILIHLPQRCIFLTSYNDQNFHIKNLQHLGKHLKSIGLYFLFLVQLFCSPKIFTYL